MQDALEKLCSIDARASHILEETAGQKKKLMQEFDEKAQTEIKKIQDEAKERLSELTVELDQKNALEIKKLSETARTNLDQLDADYKNNHDNYVQEIFTRITTGG